ncbi:regulator of cell morphogenesis and NO signaling [Cyclobacterium xiamenense]|uniref:Regulator of cell morphogenesis and NO signaling n=1 Tax=Cyclobacterium xiamenense TaxID=1297121 RepID=A0A1H7BZ18_9BACT|nr:iron-sulfur cluster repair di-iron protein [Cyclobacterium xiamenense]SEJ81597.1 regulator of cell morphogenesis and NO signaling [Cyclobacterium xiamenense]
MEQLAVEKVGDIVARDFRTAKIFTEYGIDFCCGGGVSVTEACRKKGINAADLVIKLGGLENSSKDPRYAQMSSVELIAHIVNTHHRYVEESLPSLKCYLDKLEKVHGERHPELAEINRLFSGAADALTVHMKKEELILFPYIEAMEKARSEGIAPPDPHFGHIENPIRMTEDDHAAEGARFSRLSELSQGYNPPADACQTYKVAFAMLEEFEKDLHVHIHLENNLLFPAARVLHEGIQKTEAGSR